MALSSYLPTSTPSPYANAQDPNAMVQGSLDYFLNPNSQYIQNARQRGVEYAASRGGLNSSIAAGASERAALESVMPLVDKATGINQQRDSVLGQNWLEEQGFNRQIQGQMAMLPVQSAFHMLDMLQQVSLADPELYTPDVVSGYSNFFTQNMQDIMNQYFNENGGTP